MNKINKEYITMFLGVICILVSNYMHLVLNINLLICMSVLVVYSLSFTMRNISKKMDNLEERKNLMVYLFVLAVLYISLYGCMMENEYGGMSDMVYIFTSLMVIIFSVVNSMIIIKKPAASYYKIIACISTLALCFVVTMTLETFWALFAAIPLMSVFTIYDSKNLRLVLCICINIFNIIGCVRQLTIVHKWDEYHTLWYILEIFAVAIFTMSFLKTSQTINKINKADLSTVENKRQASLDLSNETVEIGKDIQKNVYSTMQLIDDIDEATENSLVVFKEIANGNISNVESIEQQAKMTSAINNMIGNVSDAAKKAAESTLIVAETLQNNKQAFSEIKNMSNNIVSDNDKLINVFDNFITSVKKLKDIINGIAEIAEQTNLLSLNASIESVKSKNKGNEFAVVAISIKALSNQTAELTKEIDKMITLLDKNTHNAQQVVLKVVDEIDKENTTIDNTTKDFEKIETYVNNLKESVNLILVKVANVVNFSGTIEAHISQLAASSEEVSACTEEGVNLNKGNRIKAAETSTMMKEVLDVVDELKQYIVT